MNCPSCKKAMGWNSHGRCERCGYKCGCSFDPVSASDYCTSHRGTSYDDDRLKLWAHLVSEHAGIFGVNLTFEDLNEIHSHEHDGPGTIRNHHRDSRKCSLKKIGKVLIESEC